MHSVKVVQIVAPCSFLVRGTSVISGVKPRSRLENCRTSIFRFRDNTSTEHVVMSGNSKMLLNALWCWAHRIISVGRIS